MAQFMCNGKCCRQSIFLHNCTRRRFTNGSQFSEAQSLAVEILRIVANLFAVERERSSASSRYLFAELEKLQIYRVKRSAVSWWNICCWMIRQNLPSKTEADTPEKRIFQIKLWSHRHQIYVAFNLLESLWYSHHRGSIIYARQQLWSHCQ